MTRFERVFPFLVVALFGGWLASQAVPPKPAEGKVDFAALGRLPVRDGGRVMPFDTFARGTLQSLCGRTEVKDQAGNLTATATQWLAAVLDSADWDSGPGAKFAVVRIDHDQVLAKLNLPRRPGFFRYSVEEIQPGLIELARAEMVVQKKKEQGRPTDAFDAAVSDLWGKLGRYQRLAQNGLPELVPPQSAADDWRTLAAVDATYRPTEEDEQAAHAHALRRIHREFGDKVDQPDALPPQEYAVIKRSFDVALGVAAARTAAAHRAQTSPAAAALSGVVRAARDGRADEFDRQLAEYRDKYLAHVPAETMTKVRTEDFVLGHFDPFFLCAELYVVVFVLGVVGWLGWSGPIHRAAFGLAVLTLAVHTAALVVRMYVQGRPPVTNLYSSAVFIGWGAVGLSLLLERYYRNGIGLVVAGVTGAGTLRLAHFLSSSGDTLGNLVAVLDTNFWLATHVTTVTLGYTATFVAGFIAITYIARGVFTTSLNPVAEKALGQMVYGVICFATLLSFVGTVLGGIWADYSWGRFWGWDPKENGAVMIVIWNVLILHARWGGLVKNRGMAVLAVAGNMITAWSWFGTNQLGIGLHAYGFDNRLATGCRYFWLSQLAIMAVGLLPRQWWRSNSQLVAGSRPTDPVREYESNKTIRRAPATPA